MRLTQYSDFSLRVLLYLGTHPDRRCTIQEIADAYSISKNHLMKVVQQLVTRGFVRSTRGSGGGLVLSRSPEQINLGDVVRNMEPDFALVECQRSNNQCVITPVCPLPAILEDATDAFLGVLDGRTLGDLLPGRTPERLQLLLKSA